MVKAPSSSDNSFWVKVDDGEWIKWHTNVSGTFAWQDVTSGGDRTAVVFNLGAGMHTLKFKVREDGTKLDKITITEL